MLGWFHLINSVTARAKISNITLLTIINKNQMSEKKTPLQKVNAILDKLTIDEAIEAYHAAGEHLHKRIEASKIEAEYQLQKLKGE